MKRSNIRLCLALSALCLMDTVGEGTSSYYQDPEIYQLRPPVDKEVPFDCIGATGIKARFYPGVILKVEGFVLDSPAAGKLDVGDIIVGVNGTALKGLNAFLVFGKALTRAEATDGKIVLDVKAHEDADVNRVQFSIPVLGEYHETWPLNCEKSKRIIEGAAAFYSSQLADHESRDIPGALACLFLLSTGNDDHLPVVKRYFDRFPEDVSALGDHTWNNGYNGIACAEYYLRTGDKHVLPIIQYYGDDAHDRQCFESGWQHWGRRINPRYVAGGLMNPAGAQVLTTLLLAKECGVNVDDRTLLNALTYWYRFVGHGTVPYGDHRSEGGLGSNGKDGMAAAAMKVATYAKGGPGIYEKALQSLSMATLTSYPSLVRGHADEGRGDGIWRGIASSYMLDYHPDQYHEAMNRLTWWYDLSRRPSGAFGIASCKRFDDEGSGAGTAMAYTAPMKTLRITGAARSEHAVPFALPDTLWGNEMDLAFLSVEPVEGFRESGKEEPIHVPFRIFGNAYRNPDDLEHVSLEYILKHVLHRRYMIRTQAAKALRRKGEFDALARLLSHQDPRVRRAALDGLSDYRYWFHIGKNPMQADAFTPEIIAGVTDILKRREESLYVIDGALMVLSLMHPDTVGERLGLVLPWVDHDEWWMRQSAFCALATAGDSETYLAGVLPVMLDMLVSEDHTMPRQTMVRRLNHVLRSQTPTSEAGRRIIAAHMKTLKARKIIPGQRSGEGEYDLKASADLLLKQVPDRALELARVTAERLDELTTGTLTQLATELVAKLDESPSEQRDDLKDLLYTTYREHLMGRLKNDSGNLALIDTVLALTSLESAATGWVSVGRNDHTNRVWRYIAVAPSGEDVLHEREKKRFRDIDLPGEVAGWMAPEFDDRSWRQGRAPIGRGAFGRQADRLENQSVWGNGEFLLMRSSFELDAADYDYYRLRVLANQGFHVYLNGEKVWTYIWWKNDPDYRKLMLSEEHADLIKEGVNHLAVYAGSEYKDSEPMGQIDVYIEGLRRSDLLGAGTPAE